MPTCRQAVITIHSVIVHKPADQGFIFDIGVGGAPEPATMWRLQFHVAGQGATVCYKEVCDRSVLRVNRSFIVALGSLASLRVECSGVERKSDAAIEPLPVATKIITPATGWYHGQTFQIAASPSVAVSYDLVFVIWCAHSMSKEDQHRVFAGEHTLAEPLVQWVSNKENNDGYTEE